MKNRKKALIYLILTVIWMIFIFIQSALNAGLSSLESGWISGWIAQLFRIDHEQASFIIRKCAHFLEYMILGGLLSLTIKELFYKLQKTPVLVSLIAFGIGFLYAITDEFHQTFVSGRSGEVRDVLIDGCGVLLGTIIILIKLLASKRAVQKQ